MLAIMEKYANTLESLVDERTMQLAQEKKTTESLLLRMLPKLVSIGAPYSCRCHDTVP